MKNALTAQDEIAKAKGDATAAIEKAKNEASLQIAAEIAQIRELGSAKTTELANAATAAASTEQDEIAKLAAAITKAKAEVTPQIDAEIARICELGSAKSSEMSNAALAAQTTLQNEIAKLGAEVEKAKAEATSRIDAELARIRELASSKSSEITNAALAAQQDITKAKADAATAIAGEMGAAAEWERLQRLDIGKALDAQKAAILQDMTDREVEVQHEGTNAKTCLASLLIDVRNGEDDLQKQLLKIQAGQQDLKSKVGTLRTFVDQSLKLQAVIERADSKSAFTLEPVSKGSVPLRKE